MVDRHAFEAKPRGEVSLTDLIEHFSMPEKDAAKKLNLCLTSLKKLCRKHMITRWPFRKVPHHPSTAYPPLLLICGLPRGGGGLDGGGGGNVPPHLVHGAVPMLAKSTC
jgi:hypothetical protein